MSEKLKISFPEGFDTIQPFDMQLESTVFSEHISTPVEQPIDPMLMAGERGAVNVGEVVKSSRVAWHGLRATISEARRSWAGNRMEEMDHKDAFYEDAGKIALLGTNTPGQTDRYTPAEAASDKPARAERITESIKSRKIDKKFQKKMQKDIYKWRADKIYGKETEGEGYTKGERAVEKVSTSMAGTLMGETASERRRARQEIAAAPVRYGATEHKRSRKGKKKADRQFNRAASQPILGSWRELRRRDAIKDIKRHHENAEERRQKQEDIRNG